MDRLDKAVEVLNNSGIIIFPTDTAFGMGCRMDREDAVSKLFKIRKRSEKKAVPLLANSIKMVEEFVEEIPYDARILMEKYWPGALTAVLKAKKNKVLNLVRGGGDNVGFRIPKHFAILKIIKNLGVPILGTSANFSGKPTPFRSSELDKELVGLVDFVVEGRCTIKMPSTVVDCTKKPYRILRQGAIKVEN